MVKALENTFMELKPGGLVIIRDFIVPDNPDDLVLMEMIDQPLELNKIFIRFTGEFIEPVQFKKEKVGNKKLLCLSRRLAYEFYMKKDFKELWSNEINEKYGYWTKQQARNVMENIGFTEIKITTNVHSWILKNRLKDKIKLYEKKDGILQAIDFPPTHMLIVGRKPSWVSP